MSKTSTLDAPADLSAPVGSETWARGLARKIKLEAGQLDSDVSVIKGWIQIALEHRAWSVLGYASLDMFLAKETGITSGFLDALNEARAGEKVAVAKEKADSVQGKKGTSLNLKEVSGNTDENVRRRLARENHSELLDKIEAGEITTNQAAVAVGYRKPTTTVRTDNPLAAAKTLLKHYDKQELIDAIQLTPEATQ